MKKIFIFLVIVSVIVLSFVLQKPNQKSNQPRTTEHIIENECKDFIEVHTAEFWANELGQTPQYVLQYFKINLFEKESKYDKGKFVGQLLPGSRALIISEGIDDYKVKSPYDNSIGWISKIQVSRTLKQNVNTFEPCD